MTMKKKKCFCLLSLSCVYDYTYCCCLKCVRFWQTVSPALSPYLCPVELIGGSLGQSARGNHGNRARGGFAWTGTPILLLGRPESLALVRPMPCRHVGECLFLVSLLVFGALSASLDDWCNGKHYTGTYKQTYDCLVVAPTVVNDGMLNITGVERSKFAKLSSAHMEAYFTSE